MNERENGNINHAKETVIPSGGSFDYGYPKKVELGIKDSMERFRISQSVIRFDRAGVASVGIFTDPAGE